MNANDHGPFETEQDARVSPGVADIFAAADTTTGPARQAPGNLGLLCRAVHGAHVELGHFDVRILQWLANFEPTTCAVVAGVVVRAYTAGQRHPTCIADTRGFAPAEPDSNGWVAGTCQP